VASCFKGSLAQILISSDQVDRVAAQPRLTLQVITHIAIA
jgi:hypothetical protein